RLLIAPLLIRRLGRHDGDAQQPAPQGEPGERNQPGEPVTIVSHGDLRHGGLPFLFSPRKFWWTESPASRGCGSATHSAKKVQTGCGRGEWRGAPAAKIEAGKTNDSGWEILGDRGLREACRVALPDGASRRS